MYKKNCRKEEKSCFFDRKLSMRRYIHLLCAVCSCALLFSCMTVPRGGKKCSRNLYDYGVKTPEQLTAFFLAHNGAKKRVDIYSLAQTYVAEGTMEHINSDAAFVQMCVETGWLKFGGLVTEDMHNYCGLGSMDAAHPGESFDTMQMGVRAHIQHLHAYATDVSVKLNNELVDPRYSWPHKARNAKTIAQLANTWAMDSEYGIKLERLLLILDDY